MASQTQKSRQGSGKGAAGEIAFEFEVSKAKVPDVDRVFEGHG